MVIQVIGVGLDHVFMLELAAGGGAEPSFALCTGSGDHEMTIVVSQQPVFF